jgi:hypothetical protein
MPEAATDTSTSSPPPIDAMVGSDKRALDELTKSARDKQATDQRIARQEDAVAGADDKRISDAYKASGIGPDEFKPWDADKEHRKFESNPLEGFGSTGALFAMIAAAFTHAPMQVAIEGMAGALNSIKEGNEEAYGRAYDSYKENIKTALDRHKIMEERYKDAMSYADHNHASFEAKFRHAATLAGDQQALALLDGGYSEPLFQMIQARTKTASMLQDYHDSIAEKGLQRTLYEKESEELPKTGDPKQDAVAQLALHQRIFHTDPSDPKQALFGQWLNNNPKATDDDKLDAAQRYGLIGKQFKPADVASQQGYDQEMAVEGSKVGGVENLTPAKRLEIKNKWFPSAGTRVGSLGMGDEAEVKRRVEALREEHKGDPEWTEEKIFNTARAGVAAARTGGVLDDKAKRVVAGQVRAGDNSGLVGLSPANRTAVRQQVADDMVEEAKQRRETLKTQHPEWDASMLDDAAKASPEQLGKALSMASADYQGTRTALRALANRSVAIKTAATEAQKFMKVAQDASSRVPRTASVSFNRLVQMAEGEVSDPDLKEFATANNALVQQYARAIAPTGVPTDIVRKHAYDLLSTADGPEAYQRVLQVMNKEMEAAIASPDAVKDQIMKGTSGTPDAPSFSGPTIKYDKAGNRVQ